MRWLWLGCGVVLLTSVGSTCSFAPLVWSPTDPNTDPLYPFQERGKTGFIDQTGKIVIPPTFEYADEFHDGLVETEVSDGVYADKTGKIVIGHKFYRGWGFSEGLAAAMDQYGGKWGYIDRTGVFVISPRFATVPSGYVSSFSGGFAAIEVKGKTGYIDHSGEFVILPQFLKGEGFSEGFARVIVEGPCLYSNFGGCPDIRAFPAGTKPVNDLAPCKFSFTDTSGHVFAKRFEQAGAFREGFAPVSVHGKWGFIDRTGELLIEPQFDWAESFSEGLAAVREGDRWGYVNRSGAIAIAPQFTVAGEFSNGLAVAGDSYASFRYIKTDGATAFGETFRAAGKFHKGLANVIDTHGKRAYIDVGGQIVFRY